MLTESNRLNNYAVSSDGIATALQDSASALMSANNSYEEAVAMVAAGNRVVQDPSALGGGLRTIALRLRGTSVEGEEDDGLITSKSKLQGKIKSLSGVDILTDTGAYKSTYEILLEISKVWEDMSDIDQAALLEIIAGKNRSNIAASLLSNTKDLEAAYKSAQEAEGSALKENEKYLDSIQGRIDQFNNAVQSMWNSTLDDGVVKDIVSLGTEIIQLVDDVGLLNLALTGLFMYISTKYMNINWAHPIKSFKEMFGKPAITSIEDMQNNLQKLQVAYDDAFAKWKADPTQATRQGLIDAKHNLKEYETELNNVTQATSAMDEAQKNLARAQANLANYKGHDPKQLYKYQDAVKRAQAKVDDLYQSQQQVINQGATGWQKLGVKVDGFSKKVQSAISSMLIMYAISKVMDIIGDLWDKAHETAEEAKESFEDLSSKLSTTESELSTLESQLEDIKSQIKDINENTPLTFTDQEELSRLQAQSAELQRQIDLQNALKQQQQYDVNESAINAANKYAQTGVKTGKTTGENVGEKAGSGALIGAGVGVASGVGTAILGAKAGTALGAWAGPVGMLIGAAVGALAGGVIGAAVGGIESASEEKVGESLDNMKEQYTKLQEEFNVARENYKNDASDKNKKKFEEAQEALKSYQSSMAGYMSEMDSYYSQIKKNWDNATTDQKKEYNDWADKMDTWAIQSGGANAKSNAIARIFGEEAEGGFAAVRDQIDKLKENLKEAYATEDELAISKALSDLENFKLEGILSPEEVERLRNMGIYLYEAEGSFKDVAKAESKFINNDLEDVAKDINKISDGLGSLKSAFDEVIEKGYLTAKTVTDLKESLKITDASPENLTDAWREYLDVMMSGTATTEEMTEATERLAQETIEAALANNSLTPETKQEYIAQLQGLGVQNAQEYIEDLLQKNAVKEIEAKTSIYNETEVKQKWKEEKGYTAPADATRANKIWNDFSEDDIKALAKEYGIAYNSFAELSDEAKQDIIERYGIEEDAINQIISRLKEQQLLEQEKLKIQGKSENYNKWLNGDGNQSGILALDEDLEKYKEIARKYAEFSEDVRNFDPAQWNRHYHPTQADTYTNGDKWISESEFNKLQKENLEYMRWLAQNSEQVNEYIKLQEQYDKLWVEGENQGYIIDDEIIDPNYESQLNDLQTKIDGITKEIDEELTFDVELKLQLQNKSDLVDEMQNIYDTLADAEKEYNENGGYVSVDTLQSLLALEPKYIAMLYDENGQLNLNKATILQVAQARTLDMGIQAAQNVIDQASQALMDGKVEKLKQLTQATYDQTDATWGLVEANLAQLKTDIAKANTDPESEMYGQLDGVYEGVESQVFAIQDLTNRAVANIGNSFSSSGNTTKAAADDAFQKAMDYWENRIAANQARYEQLQNEIDLMEKKGQKADASYYQEQMELENQRLALLQQQKAEAQKFLGAFKEGSDEWWEVASQLNDIESEIDGVTSSIVDLQDAIAEIDTYKFEEFGNRLDNLTSKLETIRNLIAPDNEEDWFDDGDWTEAGVAVLGSHIQELEMYKQGYQETMDELAKYEPDYESNKSYYEGLGIHSEQEYYDKTEGLIKQQYDYAESISDTKNSIVDMYEAQIDSIQDWADEAISAYEDYIDVVRESLQAERDLYDFKRKIEDQSKSVAETERKIMALSGSTNAADVAERRRLEQTLYEQKRDLDDSYREHSLSSQQDALDAEQTAYEETMNKFVEGLRLSLEEATRNMDEFLMGVTSMVMYNADTILLKYQETNLPLTTELTNPWIKAKEAVGSYSGNALALMNEWTKSGGFFNQFNSIGTINLQSPWNAGTDAANAFKTSVNDVMSGVVSNISTNVKNASGELSKLYQQIVDTEARAANSSINSGVVTPSGSSQPYANPDPKIRALQEVLRDVYQKNISVNGIMDLTTSKALGEVQKMLNVSQTTLYDSATARAMSQNIDQRAVQSRKWGYHADAEFYIKNKKKLPNAFYAKGTLGTKRDEWAITDESWIGEEITLAAGKNGQLQYLKKGSAVMPADISANLVEWGKLDPSMLNLANPAANINMISNAVNKPEFNFTFDALVKAENITEEALPAVKKLVAQELDRFTKELNYALKGKGAR